MKNLLDAVDWGWLRELKVYIWGVVISSAVLFLKGLLTGNRNSCDKLKKVANEGIHLRQSLKDRGVSAYFKAGISYCLYGLRSVIDKAEPILMFGGSVFIISYFEKNPYLIDSHFPFNKLPVEFQELRPLMPGAIGAISTICINRLLRLIKLPLSSLYSLPTSETSKTEETKEKQIKATEAVGEYEKHAREINRGQAQGISNAINTQRITSQPLYNSSDQFTSAFFAEL
jgi:hypothetical protein